MMNKRLPRGVPLLFANSLLMNFGFYSLIPYLSYYLTHSLGWTATWAGVLLMVRQVSQQGIMFLTGMLADRIGYKRMIAWGMVVRGSGFALFAAGTHPVVLFSAAVVSGLGGSMFEPTSSAALKELTPASERGRIYAMKKVLSNVGIAGSAFLGALLMRFDFHMLSIVCGGVFVLTGAMTALWLPHLQVQEEPVAFGHMCRTVLRDLRFLLLVVVEMGFYFLYMQCFLTIPLRAVSLLQNADGVSLVNLLLALLVIVLQVPVNRWVGRYDIFAGMKIGFLFMGAGLVVLGTTGDVVVFVSGFVAFAIGTMIVEPSNFELTTRFAKPEMTATYFGFESMALALGGGLSQGLGGYLLQTGQEHGMPALLWGVCGAVALLAMYGVRKLGQGNAHVHTSQVPTVEQMK